MARIFITGSADGLGRMAARDPAVQDRLPQECARLSRIDMPA